MAMRQNVNPYAYVFGLPLEMPETQSASGLGSC